MSPASPSRSDWEGVPLAALEARWRVPLLEVHDTLPSTNDRARELAADGAAPFTVVLADGQSAGRGRRGRTWHSPAGGGIWMSVVLRPPPGQGPRRLLPLLVGLGAARAVERVAPRVRVGLKWPNDLEVAGRKLAGVLCESVGGGAVVAGVGVNVRAGAPMPARLRATATSVEGEADAPVDRVRLAGVLIEEVRRLLDAPPLRLEGAVAREASERDALRGRRVRLDDGRAGVAAGLSAEGALLVERDGRVEAVVAGGVRIE